MNMGLWDVVEPSLSRFIGAWCNGNTEAFEAFVLGSSPNAPAINKAVSANDLALVMPML